MAVRAITIALMFSCVPSMRPSVLFANEGGGMNTAEAQKMVDTFPPGSGFRTLVDGWQAWMPTAYELDFCGELIRRRNVSGGITCPAVSQRVRTENGEGVLTINPVPIHYPQAGVSLRWDCNLFRMARNWSMYLDQQGAIANDHGGSSFMDRAWETGLLVGAENIGGFFMNVDKIAQEFIDSTQGHCDNVMDERYLYVGVGFSGQFHNVTTMVIGSSLVNDRDTSCRRR